MSSLKTFFSNRKHKNMGFDCDGSGESREIVAYNRINFAINEGIKNLFLFESDRIHPRGFSPRLVHGNSITCILEKDRLEYSGIGILTPSKIESDAVITNALNFPILFTIADCYPIVLHDQRDNVMAVIHSGRKGSLMNIAGKTVAFMQKEFGCRPDNIAAYFFPGICDKCYILDYPPPDLPREYQQFMMENKKGISFHLQRIIIRQLWKAGIKTMHFKNFECTCCTQKGKQGPKYFSHYGFQKKINGHETPGRNALVVEMKNN